MRRGLLAQLGTPFTNYWHLRYTGKRRLGFGLPCVGATLLAGLAYSYPLNLTGDRGLVDATLPLLSLLVGFYVAALGLAVTANNPFLDKVPTNPPRRNDDELTMRAFLVDMFSFLVATSILTHVLGVVALVTGVAAERLITFVAGISELQGPIVHATARALYAGTYSFLLLKLLVVTMASLFFVAHRLQEMDDNELVPLEEEGAPRDVDEDE